MGIGDRDTGRAGCEPATPAEVSCADEVDGRQTSDFGLRMERGAVHSILSRFSKLCLEHRICMFFASFEDPPWEYGIMWSK